MSTTPPAEIKLDRLAYSVAQFATAVGLGETAIRDHIADGNIVLSYPTKTKGIITAEEGIRWLRTLPTERP